MRIALMAMCLAIGGINTGHLFGQQPNILWIIAEDMSPHLGCYGHPDARTPNIDSLARQGIVYRHAFATAPICSPARSCLATGLYATSLGTQHLRCEVNIPQRVVPLAAGLRQAGYFCTNTGKTDYNFNPEGIWDSQKNESAPWRRRKPGQPFFGLVNVGETHEGRINLRDRYEQAIANLPNDLIHDPDTVQIPPFYPDTPEIRSIFAGMHDLASVFDLKVGEIVDALKQDGDLESTIIFVFSDHGNGLPRYKRWLNDSGLRVPLVVYVPPKFRHLSDELVNEDASLESSSSNHQSDDYPTSNRLVSFVDFPATALSLAGVKVPSIMQGIPFLGKDIKTRREYVFGARSRADDMFEVSRSVFNGRYHYVRHFMPHLPYIQDSIIFADRKRSFQELRRLHQAHQLNPDAEQLWVKRKPIEDLYDLQADPHELVNLAMSDQHQKIKQDLADQLRQWIIDHRDSGFLTEAEYQIRASQRQTTPMDVVRDPSYDLAAVVDCAWKVGDPAITTEELTAGLKHKESAIRYWSAIACTARVQFAKDTNTDALMDQQIVAALVGALDDPSPSVRIATAEALIAGITAEHHAGTRMKALEVLGNVMQDTRPWVALEAASTAARLGENTKPIAAIMKQVSASLRSEPPSPRPYKDFNYASFTGWALETALIRCGETAFVESIPGSFN